MLLSSCLAETLKNEKYERIPSFAFAFDNNNFKQVLIKINKKLAKHERRPQKVNQPLIGSIFNGTSIDTNCLAHAYFELHTVCTVYARIIIVFEDERSRFEVNSLWLVIDVYFF